MQMMHQALPLLGESQRLAVQPADHKAQGQIDPFDERGVDLLPDRLQEGQDVIVPNLVTFLNRPTEAAKMGFRGILCPTAGP